MEEKYGIVNANGLKLRLRAKPNLDEDNVIELIPDGSKVLVLSIYKSWYKVETQSNTGYCLKKYISIL